MQSKVAAADIRPSHSYIHITLQQSHHHAKPSQAAKTCMSISSNNTRRSPLTRETSQMGAERGEALLVEELRIPPEHLDVLGRETFLLQQFVAEVALVTILRQ